MNSGEIPNSHSQTRRVPRSCLLNRSLALTCKPKRVEIRSVSESTLSKLINPTDAIPYVFISQLLCYDLCFEYSANKTNNEVSNSVMKAALIRTGSVSPRACISRSHSFSGVLCCENTASSRKYALHFEINCLTNRGIRRAVSVSDINVIHSGIEFSGGSNRLGRFGSRSFPAKIPEEEYQPEVDVSDEDYPFSSITLGLTGALPESGTPVEEIDFPDGGCGKGCKSGDGGDFGFNLFNGSSFDDRSKIGAYYREMLKSNPNDSLLLRNYGKFLHEVEKDTVRAEECYGRAILASPGDGDLLSLYGKLIWETQRDEDRAKSYFDQAVSASPDDCMVLGSYAHFMWEAEEDNEKEINNKTQISTMSNLVPAF